MNYSFNFMLLPPLLEWCQRHSFSVCLCACMIIYEMFVKTKIKLLDVEVSFTPEYMDVYY